MLRTDKMIGRVWRVMVFFLLACWLGAPGRSLAQTIPLARATPDAFDAGYLAGLDRTHPPNAAQEPVIEMLLKRISQYRPVWLKGWAFPTLLILTCAGVLLLLV